MRHRFFVSGAIAVAASMIWAAGANAQPTSTVTIVEGPSLLHSEGGGYLPAPGVQLRQCDVLSTGPQGLVQVELEDGAKVELGPDSRFVFDVPRGGDAAVGPHFLISGWVKLTVPKREKGQAYRVDTPHFGLATDGGVAVVHAAAESGEFFVEQGQAIALTWAPPARAEVGASRTYSRKPGESRGSVADGVPQTFVQGMPRAFRDTLPTLLSTLKARRVQPKPAPNYQPGQPEQWMKEAGLRACLTDPVVLGAQHSLQRAGIDVGPLDGILGPRTEAALRAFQQQKGLPRSGKLDEATLKALELERR
jgi:hypothetical protein